MPQHNIAPAILSLPKAHVDLLLTYSCFFNSSRRGSARQLEHSRAIKQIGYMRDMYAVYNTNTQIYTSVVPSNKYCMSTGST